MTNTTETTPILVIGGTGKTGRRVASRLRDMGEAVRIGSRSNSPASGGKSPAVDWASFDWHDPSGWADAIAGTKAIYITYQPDLAVPGAVEAIRLLAKTALELGTRRLVLLSGRGEPEAQAAEAALRESGADWTVIRAAWFAQNFSESFLLDAILSGEVALPIDPNVREPFIDADDIADVVTAALTDRRHIGQLYEVTGPRLLTVAEMVEEIARATGWPIRFRTIPAEAYAEGLAAAGVPEDMAQMVLYLFGTIMDGRNESLADGVQRALGREARDVTAYAEATAASGIWSVREAVSA
jgi:uncharacterized protein YbjT (DUF2867 family)